MNTELRELAALSALGALSPDDATRFAPAIDEHPELARELALDQAGVERLGLVADRGTAPPDLADRLVAAATATPAGAPTRAPAPATRSRPSWRRWAPALGGGLVAVAAAVALTLVATRDPGIGTPQVQAAIVAHPGRPPVTGTASLYRPNQSDGRVVVDLASLAAAPAGHHYEVWVLRAGATAMEAVGTFATPRTAPVHLELRLPGGGTYGALDISIQADGGPPEHSGASVAGATFGM